MGTLKISKDFSSTPGPRLKKQGSFSGELFREEKLLPAIKIAINNDEILTLDLDGTEGYGPSFLEESIGGLIRVEGVKYKDLLSHIAFISNEEPYLIDEIKEYMKKDAQYSNQNI